MRTRGKGRRRILIKINQCAQGVDRYYITRPLAPTVSGLKAAMIPIELWRARIGHFNCKRVRSRLSGVPVSCSRSPTSSSSSLVGRGPAAETPRLGSPNKPQDSANSSRHVSQASSTVLQTNHGTECETNRQISLITDSSSSLTLSSTSPAQSVFLLTLDISMARSLMIVLVILQLLIMSGDIETNPGPKHDGKEAIIIHYWFILFTFTGDAKPRLRDLQLMTYTNDSNIHNQFRLMDQIKPHFRQVAIALNFSHHEVAAMERSGDDPVYHLLSEWLRGANQDEDPRPATWRTLITALREARLNEAANKLEKYMVGLEPSDARKGGPGVGVFELDL